MPDITSQSTSSIGRISAAWQHLPPHVRETILTLVDSLFDPEKQVSDLAKQSVHATAMQDRFNADDLLGALEEYSGITDPEEKTGVWKLLPSHIRSAIKKHGDSLKQAD